MPVMVSFLFFVLGDTKHIGPHLLQWTWSMMVRVVVLAVVDHITKLMHESRCIVMVMTSWPIVMVKSRWPVRLTWELLEVCKCHGYGNHQKAQKATGDERDACSISGCSSLVILNTYARGLAEIYDGGEDPKEQRERREAAEADDARDVKTPDNF